jgi:hypothetical protein
MLPSNKPILTRHYEYNHGTGEHYLVEDLVDPNRPRFSCRCFCSHVLDAVCILLALGFLGFAFWLCYYLYSNADSGD